MSSEMEVLERCDLCDTPLRWRFGNLSVTPAKEFRFTAHTTEFCRDLTKHKIALLTDMLRSNAAEMMRMRQSSASLWARVVAAERIIEENDAGVRCACCELFFQAAELGKSSRCSSCRALPGAPL